MSFCLLILPDDILVNVFLHYVILLNMIMLTVIFECHSMNALLISVCHFVKCHSHEYPFVEYHFTKGHSADWHYDDKH